jgi:hypothetical protein
MVPTAGLRMVTNRIMPVGISKLLFILQPFNDRVGLLVTLM